MSPMKGLAGRIRARARQEVHTAVHRAWEWVQRHGEITPHTPGRRKFAYLGEGACIGFPIGSIYGEPWISIGDHTLVGTHVTISAGFVPGLDLGPDVIVRIGASCSLGRGTHIVGHQSIEIGDDVFTGPNVYIVDQSARTGVPSGAQPRARPFSQSTAALAPACSPRSPEVGQPVEPPVPMLSRCATAYPRGRK